MRESNGRFVAGVSGNPGGRTPGVATRIKQITGDGTEIIEFFAGVFRGEIPDLKAPRWRMQAAEWLADRMWGRSVQMTDISADSQEYAEFTLNIGEVDRILRDAEGSSSPDMLK